MNTHPSRSASQEWSSYNPMVTPVLAPTTSQSSVWKVSMEISGQTFYRGQS